MNKRDLERFRKKLQKQLEETVATVAGGVFKATAVAGSIARGAGSDEQAALAKELLNSEKDRREHRVCVDDMVTRLGVISERLVEVLSEHRHREPREIHRAVLERLESFTDGVDVADDVTLVISRLKESDTP